MTRVACNGFESGDLLETLSTSGTLSVIAAPSGGPGGDYALKVNPTTTGTGSYAIGGMGKWTGLGETFNASTLYFKFDFYVLTLPSSGNEIFFSVYTNSEYKCYYRIGSDGKIAAYNTSDTLVSTGSTALSVNTWYRIEILVTSGSTDSNYELKIDGTSEISGTMAQSSNPAQWAYLGKRVDKNSNSVSFVYDNVAVDNAEYPGGSVIKRLNPTSGTGYPGNWTTGTGTTYAEVDDITSSTTSDSDTSYLACSTNYSQAYYPVQSFSAAGISASAVKAVKVWVHVRGATADTAVRHGIYIVSGGTGYLNGHKLVKAAGTYYSDAAYYVNNPKTSATWTQSEVEAGLYGVLNADETYPTATMYASAKSTGNATSHSFSYVYNTVGGELLVAWLATDGDNTFTWPEGWNEVHTDTSNGTDAALSVRWKIAAAAEADFSVTTGSSEQAVGKLFAFVSADISTGVVGGAVTTGTSSTPDPPSSGTVTSANYRWLEIFGADDDDYTTPYASTNYTAAVYDYSNTGTGTCMTAAAMRALATTVQDPDGMAMAASEEWVASICAVPRGQYEHRCSAIAVFVEYIPSETSCTGTISQTLAAATQSASGKAGFKGTAAQTLAAATQSGAGKAEFRGTAAQVLAPATQAAAGSVSLNPTGTIVQDFVPTIQALTGLVGVVGTALQTLAPCTQSAAGTEIFSGTIVQTLAPITQSAIGKTGVVGSAVQTLAACTQAASGAEIFTGTAVQTLAPTTQAASGKAGVAGSAAQTLAACTQAATGKAGVAGSAVQVLAACTQAASGAEIFTGIAAQILAPTTQAAEGSVEIAEAVTGTIEQTLAPATQAVLGITELRGTAVQVHSAATQTAAGEEVFTGTSVQVIAPATQTAVGITELRGTIVQTTYRCEQAASGSYNVEGTIEQVHAACTQAATGLSGVKGTAAQVMAPAVQAATGTEIFTGTIVQAQAPATQAATGTEIFTGTITQAQAPATQTATGEEVFSGTIGQTIAPTNQTLAGAVVYTGTIVQAIPASVQVGVGEVVYVGTIAQTLAACTQSGTGSFGSTGFPILQSGTATSVTATGQTNHSVDLPTGYAVGDLVIIAFTIPGASTITFPDGWTSTVFTHTANGSSVKTAVHYRVITGSESSPITVTTSDAVQSSAIAFRVTNYDPEFIFGDPQTATGSDQYPNPPTSNPGTSENVLWIAGFAAAGNSFTTEYQSASYQKLGQVASS